MPKLQQAKQASEIESSINQIEAKTDPLPSSFEVGVQELEQVVRQLETGELPLLESLAAYKRGVQLIQFCQNTLAEVEQQVQILEDGLLQSFAVDRAKIGGKGT